MLRNTPLPEGNFLRKLPPQGKFLPRKILPSRKNSPNISSRWNPPSPSEHSLRIWNRAAKDIVRQLWRIMYINSKKLRRDKIPRKHSLQKLSSPSKILSVGNLPAKNPSKNICVFPNNTLHKQMGNCLTYGPFPRDCRGSCYPKWLSYWAFQLCWTKWLSQNYGQISFSKMGACVGGD